ncbi:two-component sensor histidine kinase [Cytophagales bacterium WSM2-2]|nr:two-component sensor histidine kinase [Cytophagales bacterium WSM2-2]
MQIRTRLTLRFTILVSSILILAFTVLYLLVWQYGVEEFHKRLHDKALTSGTLLFKVDQMDSTLLKTIDLAKTDVLFRENISIFDSHGKELYTNNDSLEFRLSNDDFGNIFKGEELFLTEGEFKIVGLPFEYKGSTYAIISGAIDRRGNSRLAYLRKFIFVLLPILISIVAIAGWIFADKALKPIVGVMKEVQEISPLMLTQRLSESKNNDEIGRLISIINNLLERIENAFQLQKSFVSNVSHELNNPLTKITSQLEVTLLKERDNEEYKKSIISVLDDIKEMNQLATSLLELAYVNRENQILTLTSTRIDEILWEIRDDLIALDDSYRVQVRIEKMPENEEDLYINLNPQLIKTAFKNVIENACKFSPDHTAFVSLIFYKNETLVKVIDNGLGIEENEAQKIFQPFYRTDSTSKIKGYGIGLSLSQKIISLHKGSIQVNSSPGVGTEITIGLRNS